MKLEHTWLNDMNLKTKWQLDNNSRTMSSAFVVEQQSSINQQILCPRHFSLYYTGKHLLSFLSSFWVITCWKWILLGTFFLPISDFAHHLHWQGLNPKFMDTIKNEWIIVKINPVWSGGIVSRGVWGYLDYFSNIAHFHTFNSLDMCNKQ